MRIGWRAISGARESSHGPPCIRIIPTCEGADRGNAHPKLPCGRLDRQPEVRPRRVVAHREDLHVAPSQLERPVDNRCCWQGVAWVGPCCGTTRRRTIHSEERDDAGMQGGCGMQLRGVRESGTKTGTSVATERTDEQARRSESHRNMNRSHFALAAVRRPRRRQLAPHQSRKVRPPHGQCWIAQGRQRQQHPTKCHHDRPGCRHAVWRQSRGPGYQCTV